VDALVRRLDQKRDDIDPENLSRLVKTLEEAGINPQGRLLQQLSKQATELRDRDPAANGESAGRPYERYGEDYLDGLSLSAEVSRQSSGERGGSTQPLSRGGSGRGIEGPRRSPRASTDSMSPCESPSGNGRFRAAARTAVFVNRMKRGVRFSQSAEVRKFARSSSFWDHEYWDVEDVELEEGGSAELSNSFKLRAAAKAWYKEWESTLSVMPRQAELEEACDKLIEMWLSSGFTNMWFMNGLEDGIEAFCSRLQRHPYIALMTLAKLCQRPDSFFMESEERKEAALGTLYDRLHLLQNPDSSRSGSESASSGGWSRRFSDKMAGWGERLRRKLRRGLGLDD